MSGLKRQALRIAILLLAFVVAGGAFASFTNDAGAYQARDLYWETYDVTLDVRDDGAVQVTEDQTIVFEGGPWQEGYAVIPLSRVEGVRLVEVFENGEPYERVSSPGTPGTYTVQQYGGDIEILWWFGPVSNETLNFTIRYVADGALRVYEEEQREQLWWRAIDEDFAADIQNATVTVNLPQPVPEEELVYQSYERGIEPAEIEIVDEDTIVYTASDIDQGDALEARVEFPKITTASPPSWQAEQEAREEREEQLEPFKALANLLFLGAGVLLAIGGPIGVYALWHSRGRDVPVELPVDMINEPPDDLPPGAVGTLIDERADTHDLIATMVDLAERGIIHIEETSTDVLGLSFNRDWILRKTGDTSGLRKHERQLVSAIFGSGKDEVQMSDIRKRFGTRQGKIKSTIYEELVEHDYFPHNPETVRKMWKVGGFVVIVAAIGFGIVIGQQISSFAPMVIAVAIGLGIAGVALLIASQAMPRKTEKGAEAAAKWIAFRRYLVEIDKQSDLSQAKEIFSTYLPYAVAFGIEKSWVRKFSNFDTPAPHWYGPYYGPRRHWGDTRRGRTGPIATGAGGGLGGGGGIDVPSMQDMSDGLSGSLQGMSDGLFGMFDEASDVFKPYQQSSGTGRGGGSFSGGGGSFGGGGGGGGRGFR